MGKAIITIDGVDYDGERLVGYLNGLNTTGREALMRSIVKRMVEQNPQEAVRAFRAAFKQRMNQPNG
jgi:hypothetical protein